MDIRIEDILTPERTLIDAPVSSKKKLLEYLAGFIAEQLSDSSADDIYERLLSRERLGSTGIGEGIAIPHCRLKQCDQAMGVLLRLMEPVDYDAIDRQPVDLVFTLLAPVDGGVDHLKALALVSRTLRDAALCTKLRANNDPSALYALLTATESIQAA